MSGFATQPAGHPGAFAHEFENWRWSSHRFGPPLPLKILIVVAAFWIFPPLGIAALAFLLWRLASRTGGCAFSRDAWNRGAWGGRRRGASTRNSAFEERRREILQQLDEDAKALTSSSASSGRRATGKRSTASWPSATRRTARTSRINRRSPKGAL